MTKNVVRPANTSDRASVPCSRRRKKPSRPPRGTPVAPATARFCPMIALHHAGVGRRSYARLPAILCGEIDSWEEATRRHSVALSGSPLTTRSGFSHGRVQFAERVLSVAEKHCGLGIVEEHILDPGEPRAAAALQHVDGLRLIDIQDRHPVNRAAGIVARGRV